MRIFMGPILLALVGGGSGAAAPVDVPGEHRPADQAAIRAHIDSIFTAYIQKDRQGIQTTHGRDWRGFFQQSRSIVRGIERYMEQADAFLKSPTQITAYKMLEFEVLFYGDHIAIVPYVAEMRVRTADTERPVKIRVLDVYLKSAEGWVQVASNTASHPDTLAVARQQPGWVSPALRQEILAAREAVWRAWFSNDHAYLEGVIPAETIAINAGAEEWQNQQAVLASASQFHESGARLVRLEYPRTEIQLFGDVAILYTTYLFELENQGQRETYAGRGTEIFVRRDDRWVNSGWHLDSGQ